MCGWVPGTEVPHVLDIGVLVSAWWPGISHFLVVGVWVGVWLQGVPHFLVLGVWVGAWWPGFLMSFSMAVLCSIFLIFYPERL